MPNLDQVMTTTRTTEGSKHKIQNPIPLKYQHLRIPGEEYCIKSHIQKMIQRHKATEIAVKKYWSLRWHIGNNSN